MNERLKTLRLQAINYCMDKGSQGNLSEEVAEKFAELIIKDAAECIANDVRMSMVTAESVAFDMKMRYGVE